MKKYKLLLTVALFAAYSLTFSQSKGTVGITGTVQNGQFGIQLPIWISKKTVLAPTFDFRFAQDIGIDYSLGLAPRFYINRNKLSPFVGFRAGVLVNDPSINNTINPETKVDILAGLAFGGEYFLSDNFSFGIELQGNLTKSHENSSRFGNPGNFNFNTATMISASIYF